MILMLPGHDQKSIVYLNEYYSDGLKAKGWNVEFNTAQQPTPDGAVFGYAAYVARLLASNGAKADGYIVHEGQMEGTFDKLKSKGLLLDCAAAAQRAAPDYWARWKDRIARSPYGLPLLRDEPAFDAAQWMLCVRQDAADEAAEPMNAFSDIRALAQRLADPARGGRLSTNLRDWLDCWTCEQGYLTINDAYFVYARMEDPQARPILLEDIPGFQAFLEDYLDLRARGVLFDATTQEKPDSLGDALLLPADAVYQFGINGLTLRDYTAYPLYRGQSYAHNLRSTFDRENADQFHTYALVIPANSPTADDVLAFVQWMMSSREGADAVLYGREGEGYALEGEKVALSEPMHAAIGGAAGDFNVSTQSVYSLFQRLVQPRIPAEAPENAESVLSAWPTQPLAAPWLTDLLAYHLPDFEGAVEDNIPPGAVADARSDDMQALIRLMHDGSATPSADELAKVYQGQGGEALLQWYQQCIDKARSKAGG